MCDYVGVDMLAEVESDTDAAWVSVGACVGDLRDAGRIREADGDRGGRTAEVGCGGEFFGFWGGCEGATEHQAASVSCVLCLSAKRLRVGLMMRAQPGRKPGCLPKTVCNWFTRSRLVLRICSSEGRGMVAFFLTRNK